MLPKPVRALISELMRLPTIGPRTAARLSYWLLREPKEVRLGLARALEGLDADVYRCPKCFLPSDETGKGCAVCDDPKRDAALIAVVEKETDAIAIEKTKRFKGVYHVLGGLVSATDRETNRQVRVRELVERIHRAGNVIEVILAINPTTEGDLTALYLEKQLGSLHIPVTRLGRGLPKGGDLEYADEETLSAALAGRK
ncbi:recombination protein RecR [Candidatus Parcubacteria bacterium]|nr:recombination protein RecR [Candidatus Parcubacteria bacterium]